MPNLTTDMKDLWTYLAGTDKPVVMYGMGNGADKIIDVLDRYGVTVSDFFASDGFVRGHSFRGKKVLSFSEIKEKYRDFIILLSFGTSRREVLDVIYSLDANFELYAPDVPVAGKELFNIEFYTEHKNELERARSFLADEISKEIFDCMIDYKLTGKISFLKSAVSSKTEVFKDIINVDKCRNYVDVGAYTGDTIRELYSFGAHPDTAMPAPICFVSSSTTLPIPLNSSMTSALSSSVRLFLASRRSTPFPIDTGVLGIMH